MLIIGVPVYNDVKGLRVMFDSLLDSTTAFDKIVLIESESTDGSNKTCDWLSSLDKCIETIHTPKLGPLDAYNRLFEIAKKEKADLFLTQTDVKFPSCYNRDWLVDMKKVAEVDKCGIITCYAGGGTSGPDFINGYPWVGAWCTYIPYRTIEKIGGYDMNIPLGYGVDIDYTYAIQSIGLKIYVVNYWVDHHPNYNEGHEHEKCSDFEQKKKEAFRYMREKWKVGEYNVVD